VIVRRRCGHRRAGLPSLLACVLGAAGCAVESGGARPAPVLDARRHRPEYLGPGRELPVPEDLKEIRLAHFAPADGNDPTGATPSAGAHGDRGSERGGRLARASFSTAERVVREPLGHGSLGLAKLVFQQDVWAIIGGVDGATTHLAEQIVVKACLPLVSPGGTDPSVNLTNVAWMFTLVPTDDRIAPVLADAVLSRRGDGPWGAVTTTDRDAHAAWRAFRAALAPRDAPAPIVHFALPPAGANYGGAAADIAKSGARVVLLLAGRAMPRAS